MTNIAESIRIIRLNKGQPWWVGKSGTCPDCLTMIELVNIDARLHPDIIGYQSSQDEMTVRCPGCEGVIAVKR